MAFQKKTWLARLGHGLNKFSIDGATPVPIISQPDSVTQQGDALSAGNLNDLEQRIADAFDDVEESKADKSTTDALQSQINQHDARLENLEQKAGDYGTWHYPNDPNHSSDMPNAVPTGKAKYGLVEKIVGKTRAWNQLAINISSWTAYKCQKSSYSDGVQTVTAFDGTSAQFFQQHNISIGKTVLVSLKVKPSKTTTMRLWLGSGLTGPAVSCPANVWTTLTWLKELTVDGSNMLVYLNTDNDLDVNDTVDVTEPIYRDLTLIFGAGNEPSTVADALAQLPALGQYNAYDAGSLVSTEVSGAKSGGFNLWDEQTQGGYYNASGVVVSRADQLCTLNRISIKPNTAYYYKSPNPLQGNFCFYDASGNFLLRTDSTASFTSPSNAYYLNVSFGAQYGSTYNHNICINISGSEDGTYKPYREPVTLSLSEPVTLRSAGSVADTDELNVEVLVDGVKVNKRRQTSKVGQIDLGTLDWELYEATATQPRRFGNRNIPLWFKDSMKLLCSRLVASVKNDSTDKTIWTQEGYLVVVDTSSTYASASDFKTAMNGVMLNYELATPVVTLSDPIIDNFLEVEGGGTIDTIQEQSPVIDNCLDVGYLTL